MPSRLRHRLVTAYRLMRVLAFHLHVETGEIEPVELIEDLIVAVDMSRLYQRRYVRWQARHP